LTALIDFEIQHHRGIIKIFTVSHRGIKMEKQAQSHDHVEMIKSKKLLNNPRIRGELLVHTGDALQKFILHSGLSMDATCLIVYLSMLPEEFSATIAHIKTHFKIGQRKINRIIGELMDAGYVYKEQRRDKGKYTKSLTLYSYYPEFKNS
jgi:hypothetical protein